MNTDWVIRPYGANKFAKFGILSICGSEIPKYNPIYVTFGVEYGTFPSAVPNLAIIGGMCRGENPQHRYVSNCNTGAPVGKSKKTVLFFVFCGRTPNDLHRTLHADKGYPSRFCTCLTFPDPVHSSCTRSPRKFLWKLLYRGFLNITRSSVHCMAPNFKYSRRPHALIKPVNFMKID